MSFEQTLSPLEAINDPKIVAPWTPEAFDAKFHLEHTGPEGPEGPEISDEKLVLHKIYIAVFHAMPTTHHLEY